MGCCSALLDIVYNFGRWVWRSTLFFVVASLGFGLLPYYGPPIQAFLAEIVYYPETLYHTVRASYGIPAAAFALVLFLTCCTYLYERWLHETTKQKLRDAWTWLRLLGKRAPPPTRDDGDDDANDNDDDDGDDDTNDGGGGGDGGASASVQAEYAEFLAWKRARAKNKTASTTKGKTKRR